MGLCNIVDLGGEEVKPVKDKGLEELMNFKSRLAKSYGMRRIVQDDFDRIHGKIIDLIEEVKELEEKEEGLYE